MKATPKKKPDLAKTLKKVLQTPASFAFFVTIHDFVECIELNGSFGISLARDTKYAYLKQIHQGIKDISKRSTEDLGHERYMVINDLSRIQKQDVSDSNSFWKKREVFRKLAVEIYERLNPQPLDMKQPVTAGKK